MICLVRVTYVLVMVLKNFFRQHNSLYCWQAFEMYLAAAITGPAAVSPRAREAIRSNGINSYSMLFFWLEDCMLSLSLPPQLGPSWFDVIRGREGKERTGDGEIDRDKEGDGEKEKEERKIEAIIKLQHASFDWECLDPFQRWSLKMFKCAGKHRIQT